MADKAKVFMSGRSQAVRLPKAYRVDAVSSDTQFYELWRHPVLRGVAKR